MVTCSAALHFSGEALAGTIEIGEERAEWQAATRKRAAPGANEKSTKPPDDEQASSGGTTIRAGHRRG